MNYLETERTLTDGILELRLATYIIGKRNQFYYRIYLAGTEEIVGTCGIRLDKSEENYILGNIEYEIFPKHRGHHYAEDATRLLSEIALMNGIDELIITANPKNKASLRTIENLGGIFIDLVKVPKDCCLRRQGYRNVKVYSWDITNLPKII